MTTQTASMAAPINLLGQALTAAHGKTIMQAVVPELADSYRSFIAA